MPEVGDWGWETRGDDHAVPEREAAAVPVGQAPGHRTPLDQEVRVEDPAEEAQGGQAQASSLTSWHKVSVPEVIRSAFPNARCWRRSVPDGWLTVLRTIEPTDDGSAWLMHVSISHAGRDGHPARYPTWDEQKEAVWRFAPGRAMASYLPAEGQPYVNLHATTFHWWEVSAAMVDQIMAGRNTR